jgi:hypothetical protein
VARGIGDTNSKEQSVHDSDEDAGGDWELVATHDGHGRGDRRGKGRHPITGGRGQDTAAVVSGDLPAVHAERYSGNV